jgi:hypothetical protein
MPRSLQHLRAEQQKLPLRVIAAFPSPFNRRPPGVWTPQRTPTERESQAGGTPHRARVIHGVVRRPDDPVDLRGVERLFLGGGRRAGAAATTSLSGGAAPSYATDRLRVLGELSTSDLYPGTTRCLVEPVTRHDRGVSRRLAVLTQQLVRAVRAFPSTPPGEVRVEPRS